MTCVAEMVTTDIQTLSFDKLHAKQKKDIYCRNSAAHSHHKKEYLQLTHDFPLSTIQYVYGLKFGITIAPHSIVPVILHESHNSKWCQWHDSYI